MAILTVRQTGGDHSSLSAALSAASAGDTISIEGTWTVDDTGAATISDDNLTITADADSRHPGYWDESQNHYRLVVTGNNHALELSGDYTITLDGVAVQYTGSGNSYESFRCVPGTADTVTATDCLIFSDGTHAEQDCVYTGFNTAIGTITLENCVIYNAQRGGINSQNDWSQHNNGTVNVNSCTIWGNARGIHIQGSGGNFVINVHNTICVGNATQDYDRDTSTLNVSYSIDSDGSIATDASSGTGNLASRTATDNTSPGAGDWVIFEDITNNPFDLRLIDNAENDAQDMHTTDTAHGLTIPSTDIVGTARPQNTNHDCGAFEIVVAGGPTVTLSVLSLAGSLPTLTPVPGGVSTLLSVLSVTGSMPTLSVSPGGVSILLNALTLTASAESPTIVPGAVSVLLNALTVTGSLPSVSISAGTFITLASLILTGSLPNASIVPGGVSVPLNELSLAGSVESVSVLPGGVSVLLNVLTLLASAEVASVVPGGVSILLNELTLASSVENITLATGVLVLLASLTLDSSVPQANVIPGAVNVLLNTLSLTSSAETMSVSIGILIALQTLSLVSSAEGVTPVPGAVSVLLEALTLVGAIESASVVPGGVATLLETLSLTSNVETLILAAEVAIVLQTLSLTGSVQNMSVLPGVVSVALSTLSLASSLENINAVSGLLAIIAAFGIIEGVGSVGTVQSPSRTGTIEGPTPEGSVMSDRS